MFYPVNGDPYRSNVVLHLPMTGANNSTTFTDVSQTPKTIARYGNTIISTAQSKWGQGSGYFDGNDDALSAPDSSDWDLSNQNFTIEAFVWLPALTGVYAIVSQRTLSTSNHSFTFFINQTALILDYTTTGTNLTTAINRTHGMNINTWYHLAAVRDGNSLGLFVNGALLSTWQSFTATIFSSSSVLSIGGVQADGTIGADFSGYLQDLRITKGIARYTADFAVPAGPLPFRSPEVPLHRPIIQPPSFTTIARVGL